jgi:exonuclease VII large subunit
VAHMKNLLEQLPRAGDNVAIVYSSNHAQMRDIRERVNAQELAR